MATDTNKPSRRRWILRGFLLLIVLLLVAGLIAGLLLDNDKVRGLLTEQLGQLVGLPASVERVNLSWFPVPGLTAYGIRAGDNEIEIRAASATAYVDLLPLLTGRVAIDTIDLDEVGLTLPEDNTRVVEVWNHVSEQLSGGEGGGWVTLGSIRADHIHATRGGRIAAQGSLEVGGLDDDVIVLATGLRAPIIAPQAELDAVVNFDTAQEATGVSGSITLDGFSVESPVAARADLKADLSGDLSELSAALSGILALPGEDALEGPVSAVAWWKDDKIIVNDFQWQAPGVEAICDLTWTPGDVVALEITRAALPAAGIAAVLARYAPAGVRVAPQDSARFTAKEVLIGIDPDGGIKPYRGEATFFDIDFLDASGAALLDNIGGRVRLDESTVYLDEIKAEGLSLSGRVTPDIDTGLYAVTISGNADLAVADPSPWLPLEGLRLDSGGVRIENLGGTFGGGSGVPDDFSIALALEGVSGAVSPSAGAEPVPFTGLTGGVRNEGAGWVIEDLRAEGIRLSGSIAPAEGTEGWALDLSGGGELSSPLIGLALPDDVISNAGGSVAFTRLFGVFVPGEGAPRNLAIEGRISEGRATLTTTTFEDTFSGVNASFSTSETTIDVDATLTSAQFGPISWDGTYASGTDVLQGSLRANLGRAAAMFVPASQRDLAGDVLGSFGDGPFNLTLELRDERKTMALALQRNTAPALDAKLSMRSTDSGWNLTSLNATASVALEQLASALPEGIRGSGTGDIRIAMDPGANAISIDAELDAATIRIGDHLTKREGQTASAAIDIQSGALQTITINALEETFTLRTEGDGLASEAFNLDLARLRPLLNDGAVASGTVSGTFQTSPTIADLQLSDVAFSIAPGLGVDSLNGGIRYRSGLVEVDNLRIRGANSDCTLTAETYGESWRGDLSGDKLDLNAVLAMYQTFGSMGGGGGGDAAGGEDGTQAADTSYAGTLSVNLGEVYYNTGMMRNLQTQVSVVPSETVLSELVFVPGEGTANGTITIRSATEDTPTTMLVKLNLTGADLAELDRLLFTNPREVAGQVEGIVDIRFPLDDAPLNGLNGNIEYTATDGTYGKFGIATKLLGLLRTTELIRLRLPSLRDKGLNFDKSTAKFRFEEGVMHWDEMEVTAKSHSFGVSGLIDFPQNETDLVVRMHLLEAVTGGLIGQLPVIKQTVNVIKKATPMRVRITGPPLEPDAAEDASDEPVDESTETETTAEEEVPELDDEVENTGEAPAPEVEVFEVDAVDPPQE